MALKWKLKACRVQAGLTQKEAAEYLGVSEQSLIYYENGRNTPNMDIGQKMSELYQIPLEIMDFSKIGNTVIKN